MSVGKFPVQQYASPVILEANGPAFSNTSAAHTLLTAAPTIPTGQFNAGDLLQLYVGLLFLNNSGATQTLTLKLLLGGTAIVNLVTAALAASATTYNVIVKAAVLLGAGSTNAVSELLVSTSAATGTTAMSTFANPAQGSLAGLSGTLDIQGTCSTGTTTTTVTPKSCAVLWIPGPGFVR